MKTCDYIGCTGYINGECNLSDAETTARSDEHGTCYQLGKLYEISVRLARLAVEMADIAVEMEYFGGSAPWAQHARELQGASGMAVEWSKTILAESV